MTNRPCSTDFDNNNKRAIYDDRKEAIFLFFFPRSCRAHAWIAYRRKGWKGGNNGGERRRKREGRERK